MLTILTPTYNRGEYLERVYNSLVAQTDQNFEWLLIDDGSTDNTEEVVRKLAKKNEHAFHFRCYFKPNGGKHTALNYGARYAAGDIVLILDSDDYLTSDAVASVYEYWEQYKHNKKICGLSFLKAYDANTPVAVFKKDVFLSDHISYRINKHVKGDCCEIIRTEVLKEFPFPEFEGEKFLGENYLWVNSALKYDTVYIKKIIYICEYLEGGLTKSGRQMRMKNPRGGMVSSKVELNHKICLSTRIKKAILYSCYGYAAGMKSSEIKKSSGYPLIVGLFIPVGWFLYLKWNKR